MSPPIRRGASGRTHYVTRHRELRTVPWPRKTTREGAVQSWMSAPDETSAMPLHPSVEERLARLAPDQRAAATAPPGPILCVAPAGSGKTTTLVARICWLVAGGQDPGEIAAITFNKRAAEEL